MTIIFIAALLAVRPASFRGDGPSQETALTDERTTNLEESAATAAPTATFSAMPTATPAAAPTATPLAVPACASCLKAPCAPSETKAAPKSTLPWSAILSRIHGYRQSLPLDCEARSAVDWAAYFGEMIAELDFFGRIPASDNPEKGFVGDVHGRWGNLPPKSYGVHAGPVALLLRDYGVRAYAYRGLVWEKMQSEVAAGRPVIAWVTGHIGYSPPVIIDLAGGESARVARYEHTVIVFGYEEERRSCWMVRGATSST